MVIAVFMAMIVIGFLYYLVGLGDAILAQERMQDAADATAFSSAVIHARGMNVLALLNIIMASMLAILVLMSMVVSLLQLGILVLSVAGILVPGLLGGIPPLRTQQQVVRKIEKSLTPKVEKIVVGIHKIQGPLSKVIPIIANVNAMKLARESYGPVVKGALTFPILSGLPTDEGTFEKLCRKAGAYAGEMAVFPITGVISFIPGKAADYLSGFLVDKAKNMGEAYAMYYCGIGPKPPAPSHTIEIGVPELNSTAQVDCKNKSGEASESRQEKACEQYDAQMKSIREDFDPDTGDCDSREPELRAYCEQMRTRARNECNPNKNSGLRDYKWWVDTVTRTYEIRDKRVSTKVDIKGEPKEAKNVFWPINPDMCLVGASAFGSVEFSDEWNHDTSKPVCTTPIEKPPTIAELKLASGRRITHTHREVTHIFQCTKRETLRAPLKKGEFSEKMKKLPQAMCNCAVQGGEYFQIRSVVYGDAKAYTETSDKRILVATGGQRPEQSTIASMAEWGGRFAAAQAEFYFEDNGDDSISKREEWLWHMNWKARLRRLQLRSDAKCKVEKNTCPGANGVVSNNRYMKKVTELLNGTSSTIISH